VIPAPRRTAISTPAPRLLELLLTVALVVILFGLAAAGYVLLRHFAPGLLSFWSVRERAAILLLPLEGLVLCLSVWLGLRRPEPEKRAVLGIVSMSSPWPWWSILAGLALFVAAIGTALLLQVAVNRPFRGPAAEDLGLVGASPIRFAYLLLMGGYFVPFAEELLFRGVVFRWLLEMLGFVPAAFLSAAIFGGLHFGSGIDHVWVTFAYGLVFAWLYARSGSLWAPVFAHRTTNSISITIAWLASSVGPPGPGF
jgi:membrane protease YdiL (CAAX protease family)